MKILYLEGLRMLEYSFVLFEIWRVFVTRPSIRKVTPKVGAILCTEAARCASFRGNDQFPIHGARNFRKRNLFDWLEKRSEAFLS